MNERETFGCERRKLEHRREPRPSGRDLAELELWLDRAATGERAAELFGDAD